MAVKKTSKTGEASAPKAAAKKSATTKSATPKAGEGATQSVASETPSKAATAKGSSKTAPAAAAAATGAGAGAKKKAAEVKLNDLQRDFLKKIHGAGEPGYRVGQKVEQRTIDALESRKLLKKGAKHKESGTYHYVLTKAGQKHISTPEA